MKSTKLTVLESYSDYIIITPNVLTTASGKLIGSNEYIAGIIDIEFNSLLEVPSNFKNYFYPW